FHPQRPWPRVDPTRVTQHADILPSILDYLQIEPPRSLLFGRSVFHSGEGRAFLHVNGHYWLVRDSHALEFAPDENQGRLFDLAQDPQLKSPEAGEIERKGQMEKEAGALLQYFNNGMLDNNL